MKQALVVVLLLAAAACSGGKPAASTTPGPTLDPAYCPGARKLDVATARVDIVLLDPALLRARYPTLQLAFADARAHAPAQLQSDYTFLGTTLEQFGTALRSVGFEFRRLSPVLRALATNPNGPVAAARARIRAYGVAHCGLSPSPSAT
jgi:hypothetical protein